MNSLTAVQTGTAKARLMTQLQKRIRLHHFALATEEVYVHWIQYFNRSHGLAHIDHSKSPQRLLEEADCDSGW